MRLIDGRKAITTPEIAEVIGYSEPGARALYRKRAENGHPESAFNVGRTKYWWQDEIEKWWEEHLAATRPEKIERVGDPDELLFAQDVADLLGYADPRTVLSMHSRGQFREPDNVVPAGQGQKSGQARPQWKRSTIWDYADSRTTVRRKTDDAEQVANDET